MKIIRVQNMREDHAHNTYKPTKNHFISYGQTCTSSNHISDMIMVNPSYQEINKWWIEILYFSKYRGYDFACRETNFKPQTNELPVNHTFIPRMYNYFNSNYLFHLFFILCKIFTKLFLKHVPTLYFYYT